MKKLTAYLFILILFVIAIASFYFVYQISSRPNNIDTEKQFVINPGETVNQISQKLYDQKLIKSKIAFEFYLYIKRLESSIKAGTYSLQTTNIINLADILVAGKVDNEIELKFIEGWTAADMAAYLVEQKIITNPKDFLAIATVNNFKTDYDFLTNISNPSLEGFLFPDTYRLFKDAATKDIVIKMLNNFDDKLTPALQTEITAQRKNLYDILIMASILEMEVPTDNDRQIVAGILWKRLQTNMPLQVDSTLKYIIGKKNRNALTYDELAIDSPYNTYKYKGLPPSPIANPGLSAIRAAIYPKDSDYWFYLSNKAGETIFSTTAEEHAAAVNKYLR